MSETVPKHLMPKITKDELYWINLGVEFARAKEKGTTARAFAASKEINYGTFTKSMYRYKAKINDAVKADQLSKKPTNKLTKNEKAIVMINSFRNTLRKRIKTDGPGAKTKSEKWFRETVKTAIRGHKVSKPTLGKIYAFAYDAKHKETLPYWDMYPLIVCLGFSVSSKSKTMLMHGLNLHYIPPKARQTFLEELLKKYANTTTITNSTKLDIDWGRIKGMKGAELMIKSYLPDHINGTLVEVKPSDWANVVLMPLQKFVSQGKSYSAVRVWSKFNK